MSERYATLDRSGLSSDADLSLLADAPRGLGSYGEDYAADRVGPLSHFLPSTSVVRKFGWIPDIPDRRDIPYIVPRKILANLPRSADLRRRCPPVLDQGELGSCTAHAIANACRFDQIKRRARNRFQPSALFIYYNGRTIAGTARIDAGAQIRDGLKSIARWGVCPEEFWTSHPDNFARRPSRDALREAEKNKAVAYRRVIQDLSHLRGCIADGQPFVFGMSVYESFTSETVARTGKLPMPGSRERQLGGHAALAVGYDDERRHFVVMNSWSSGWGDKGYFYVPYAYLGDANLADDFWVIGGA